MIPLAFIFIAGAIFGLVAHRPARRARQNYRVQRALRRAVWRMAR